jgi:hypothetical protein
MAEIPSLFPDTYENSRARFRENLGEVQAYWPSAQLLQHRLPGEEDLTMDWIVSDALERNAKVFILTIGEHGIEGYVGSAMQQFFIENYLSRLDPQVTGILLVHAINPWGMKYHRRVNANNVDLNRNFLWEQNFDTTFNPGYDSLNTIINSNKPVESLALGNLDFYVKLAWKVMRIGWPVLKHTLLIGQYRHSQGIFYGGEGYQEETRTIIKLFRRAINNYSQILHLDMHTGYGPRYLMSLVNSAQEPQSSQEFRKNFDYPLVVAANPEEFYGVRGDMIDYIYTLRQHEFPEKKLYATSFEFGTLGDTFYGQIGFLRAVIFENRLYWRGTVNDRLAYQVRQDYEKLFNPVEDDWRAKAVADANRAFSGILKAEGYIKIDE